MKTKILIVTLLALLFINLQSIQAQTRLGIRAGLNLADVNGKTNGESVSDISKSRLGFHAGLVADITFADNFYFQPGLLFSTKGFKIEESQDIGFGFGTITTSVTANVSYLEIPLNLGYRIDIGSTKIIPK